MQELRKKYEDQRKNNEGKFIPMEGTENDIYVHEDAAVEIQDGEYIFYQFKVTHDGKEKTFRLFLNQAVEMGDALAKHKDRKIHVSRGKQSKKIVFS